MTEFTKYQPDDFLANESFVNYLLQKNISDSLFWEKWIKENAACKKNVEEAIALYFLIRDQKDNSQNLDSIEKEYAKLQDLVKNTSSGKESKIIPFNNERNRQPKIYSIKFAWKAAAVACVVLISISLWMYFGTGYKLDKRGNTVAFATTEKNAENILLPDGSEVLLNQNSAIAISKAFNKSKRELTLSGSAFFKVHKDHSKPFIVTSGNIKTTAVGTSFYIYNLHAQNASVLLLEGKVKIEGKKNLIYLLPGEKAVLDSNDFIFKKSFNKKQLQNFINGRIVFEHAGIKEIKNVLEEYFNIDVAVNGPVPSLNFTGDFDSKNIQQILESLQFTYNIKYQLTGQKITISF